MRFHVCVLLLLVLSGCAPVKSKQEVASENCYGKEEYDSCYASTLSYLHDLDKLNGRFRADMRDCGTLSETQVPEPVCETEISGDYGASYTARSKSNLCTYYGGPNRRELDRLRRPYVHRCMIDYGWKAPYDGAHEMGTLRSAHGL